MKQIGKQLVLCAGCGIMNLVLFSLLLRTPLFENVFIYYSRILYLVIIIAIFSVALLCVICLLQKKKAAKQSFWSITPVEVFTTSLVCTLCMALLVSVASMPLDRSYTIYSLVDMADHPQEVYTIEDVEEQFINGYINEMGATQRRIDEQVSLGNIAKVDGGYQITEKGTNQVKLFRFYEMIFPINEKRILYPQGE